MKKLVVDIIDEEWVKVKLKNGEGYVASKYLQKEVDEQGLNGEDGKSKTRVLIGN